MTGFTGRRFIVNESGVAGPSMRPAGDCDARVFSRRWIKKLMITALKQLFEQNHTGDLRALKKA